jgi:hypothetical protein
MRIWMHLTLTAIISSVGLLAGLCLGSIATLYAGLALKARGFELPVAGALALLLLLAVGGAYLGVTIGRLFAVHYLPARCPKCGKRALYRPGYPITYQCFTCYHVHYTPFVGGWSYWIRPKGRRNYLPIESPSETEPPAATSSPRADNNTPAGDQSGQVDSPIKAPLVERVLAVAYVLSPVVLYVVAPVLGALGLFLWSTRGKTGWGLGLFLVGRGCLFACLAFRNWVVRWGRRRSAARDSPGGQNQSTHPEPNGGAKTNETADNNQPPVLVLIILCVVSLAFGISGVVYASRTAVSDFRIQRGEATGVRLQTRIVDKPRQGARWTEEALMEYPAGGNVQREWLETQRFKRKPNDREMNDSEKGAGERRTVWYDPDNPSQATLFQPDPWASVRATVFCSIFVIGGLGLAWILLTKLLRKVGAI